VNRSVFPRVEGEAESYDLDSVRSPDALTPRNAASGAYPVPLRLAAPPDHRMDPKIALRSSETSLCCPWPSESASRWTP
jgi:hypothetical protein